MDELKPACGINLKDYPNDILNDKYWRATEKIDGVFRTFYKHQNGRVTAYNKLGKSDPWLSHITEYLSDKRFPSNKAYTCDLVDRKAYFAKVESYLLRTVSNAKASQQFPDQKEDLMAVCFDIYTPRVLEIGRERDDLLRQLFSQSPLIDPVIMVPSLGVIFGQDMELIDLLMNYIDVHNGEGIMLMNLDSMYIPGRSKELIKVKRVSEFIGTLIDVELADDSTKIAGGVSALIAKVEGCTVPVRVGTGLSMAKRLDVAKNTDKYIDRTFEIESLGKTKSSKGHVSLSVPVFKRFI